MPKASPARGWRPTYWPAEHTITFTAHHRVEILTWVEPPTREAAAETIARVTSVLEDYLGSAPVYDSAPRPANQIAMLDEIIGTAAPFIKSLQDLDSKTRALLRQSTVNPRELVRDLTPLLTVAHVERLKLSGTESRGAKKRGVLRATCRDLTTISGSCTDTVAASRRTTPKPTGGTTSPPRSPSVTTGTGASGTEMLLQVS